MTPFSFIDFFLHKFNGGNAPSKLSVSRSVELILGTIRGRLSHCLGCKPHLPSSVLRLVWWIDLCDQE